MESAMKTSINSLFPKLFSLLGSGLALGALLAGCSKTPTGRSQLTLMPEGQMAQMGEQSFSQLQKEQKVSQDKQLNAKINCISKRIVENLEGENDFSEWDVKVFEDEAVNAFALPGKNIGVYTGLIKAAENNAQIASVIGHEVGHVLAEHGNERVSQNLAVQGGLAIADIALNTGSAQNNQLIMGALGLGAQLGVLLPYSRKHESEADQIGLNLMARAGFQPQEAVEFWRIMSQQSEGKEPPKWLSTHPANQERIDDLQERMKEAKEIYQANKAEYGDCP